MVQWEVVPIEEALLRQNGFKHSSSSTPTVDHSSPRAAIASASQPSGFEVNWKAPTGPDSWEAGDIDALFDIGKCFRLLFQSTLRASRATGGIRIRPVGSPSLLNAVFPRHCLRAATSS